MALIFSCDEKLLTSEETLPGLADCGASTRLVSQNLLSYHFHNYVDIFVLPCYCPGLSLCQAQLPIGIGEREIEC